MLSWSEGLHQDIEKMRLDWANVGLAVAVVRGQDSIYSQGFGVRQFGHSLKVDSDTLFQVGSTTKAFTTAALGILVEEGKLQWDDPLVEYLSDFRLQDPWLTRTLTLRDAVTHRSGISARFYFVLGVLNSVEALCQLRYARSSGAFRDSFCYDNLMYAAAGKAIETVSGMTWGEFVSRRLLRPLKMNRSSTTPSRVWETHHIAPVIFGAARVRKVSLDLARDTNVAMPHAWDEDEAIAVMPWQSYDNAAAAGSLVSSVNDMANWVMLNLNDGRFEDQELLKPETIRALHAPQNLHSLNQFPFEPKTESYAMGWFRAEYRSYVHLEHGGGILGFPAYVALLPEEGIGVVVLSNGSKVAREKVGVLKTGLHRAVAFSVFDRLLGLPTRDWNQELLRLAKSALYEQQQREVTLKRSRLKDSGPPVDVEKYEGTYEDVHGHSGLVRVSLEDEILTLKFCGEGAFSARLEHWHLDLFRLRMVPGVADALGSQFARFTLDCLGEVAEMTVFGERFQRRMNACP